jgi:hypothetical protein
MHTDKDQSCGQWNFSSVFICVHPWLNPASTAWFRLSRNHAVENGLECNKESVGAEERGIYAASMWHHCLGFGDGWLCEH